MPHYFFDRRFVHFQQSREWTVRCNALGRKNWTFLGLDQGGRRAAAIYTLIETAKLNDIDPQAWLADVLARLPDHPAKRIDQLLPWNCARRTSRLRRLDQARRLNQVGHNLLVFTGRVR